MVFPSATSRHGRGDIVGSVGWSDVSFPPACIRRLDESAIITSMTRKSDTPGSRTEFQSLHFGTALLLATIIQSLSLSDISSSISSYSSSSISGVIAFIVYFFFVFLFDASASTSSTSSSISYVLKTNFPLIATRFPFLRSLRTCNSSLYSAFSFRKRAFSDIVLSRADPDRLI
jgi:hypothetical protein